MGTHAINPCLEPLRSACLSQCGEEITRLSYIKAVDIRPLLTYKTGRVPQLVLIANCTAAHTESLGHVHLFCLEMRQGSWVLRESMQRPPASVTTFLEMHTFSGEVVVSRGGDSGDQKVICKFFFWQGEIKGSHLGLPWWPSSSNSILPRPGFNPWSGY